MRKRTWLAGAAAAAVNARSSIWTECQSGKCTGWKCGREPDI